MKIKVYEATFDKNSPYWENDEQYRILFIRQQISYLMNLMKCKGHLYLNDVLNKFGLNGVRQGWILGWTWDRCQNMRYEQIIDVEMFKNVNIIWLYNFYDISNVLEEGDIKEIEI